MDQAIAERKEAEDKLGTENLIFVAEDVNVQGAKRFMWKRTDTVLALMDSGTAGNLYEVVFGGKPLRFFADIDILEPDHYTTEEYIEMAIEVIVKTWNQVIIEYPVTAADFVTKFSNYSVKISFHIVGPTICFEDVSLIKKLMMLVEQNVFKNVLYEPLQAIKTSTVFDLSVYRRRGCMRLLGASKFGRPVRMEKGSNCLDKDVTRFLIHPVETPDFVIDHILIEDSIAPIRVGASVQDDTPLNKPSETHCAVPDCHCRYGDPSEPEYDMDNGNLFLRHFPINQLAHMSVIQLLIAAKKACVKSEDLEHLLDFRYRHALDRFHRIKRKMDFFDSFVLAPHMSSIRHLLMLYPRFGMEMPQGLTPDLFQKALEIPDPVPRNLILYNKPDGRAQQINVNPIVKSRQSFLAISPMGSGKTFQQLQLVKDALRIEPKATVIVISCRQLMARDIERRYKDEIPDIQNYLTIKEAAKTYRHGVRNINLAKKLIIQLESLHLLDMSARSMRRRSPLIFVVDEAETVFAQFISSTMDRQYRSTWKTFRQLVEQSWITLFAEAIPSQRTYELCQLLCPRIQIERNLAPRVSSVPQRTISRYPAYHSLVGRIVERVKTGERCGIFCSTKTIAKKIHMLLVQEGVLVQAYHSDDRTTHADFSNLHDAWDKFQVVIWTSVVTVGISYDLARFDFMCAFIGCKGPFIRDCVQAVHRIRNLSTNEVLYAAKGPFKKPKKGDADSDDEDDSDSVVSFDGGEDAISVPFFETDEVMKKYVDDRNTRIEREFHDMIDAADPAIRRLVYYSICEQKLQGNNAMADRLFEYFMVNYIGYLPKEPILPVQSNEEDFEVEQHYGLALFDFKDGVSPETSAISRDILTPDWESETTIIIKKEQLQPDDSVAFVPAFEQTVQDSMADLLDTDPTTLGYRQEIKKMVIFLRWCDQHTFVDMSDREFMEAAWDDFKKRKRTWTHFPKIIAEDMDHESALENAILSQKKRTENVLAVASDRDVLELKTRWELQKVFGVSTTYEMGTKLLNDTDLINQFSRLNAVYQNLFAKPMTKKDARGIRFHLSQIFSNLQIGVNLGVQKTQPRGGQRIYSTFWCPLDHAMRGAGMATGIKPVMKAKASKVRKEKPKEVYDEQEEKPQKRGKKCPFKH